MVQAEDDDVVIHDVKRMAKFSRVPDSCHVFQVNPMLAEKGHQLRSRLVSEPEDHPLVELPGCRVDCSGRLRSTRFRVFRLGLLSSFSRALCNLLSPVSFLALLTVDEWPFYEKEFIMGISVWLRDRLRRTRMRRAGSSSRANGKFAFTSDTASSVITGFQLARDGGLTILNADGRSATLPAGSAPTDLTVSENSRFLFSLNPGAGTIAGWRIAVDGSLLFTGAVTGTPPSATGIAAR
jgi:hypothetical protein